MLVFLVETDKGSKIGSLKFSTTAPIRDLKLYIFLNIIHTSLVFYTEDLHTIENKNESKHGSCDIPCLISSFIYYVLPLIFSKIERHKGAVKNPVMFVVYRHICYQNVFFPA